MKAAQNFNILYVLLVICQTVLCNYCPLGPYITLSMLPAMVLCLPLKNSNIMCMLIAFASALAVDWISEGVIGLNVAALLPVALTRKTVIRVFLGEDLINRSEMFTFRKNGMGKISAAILTIYAIYLGMYVFLDGAGTRPLWFDLTRFGASLAANWLLALLITGILTPDDRK